MGEFEDRSIFVTVLDTETGEVRKSTHPAIEFWWTEGNGACDCNRELMFGRVDDDTGYCIGCKRYVIVDVVGLNDSDLAAEFIATANCGYPEPLRDRANTWRFQHAVDR